MKVGQKRTYVVRKITDFLKAIENRVQYPFTKIFTYDPTEQKFTQEDQEIINLLQEAVKFEDLYRQFQSTYYQSSGMGDERAIRIPPMIADDLLKKLNNSSICFETGGESFNQIHVYHNKLPFSIQLDKGRTDEFQLDLTEIQTFTYLDLYGYMIQENIFYKISPEQQVLLKELKTLIEKSSSPLLPIANDQIEPFISQVIPVIEKIGELEITDKVSSQIVKFPLQAKAYIDLVDDLLYVSLEFHYGEHKLDPFKHESQEKGVPIIMRDAEKEQSIMGVIEATSLKFNGKGLYIEGEEGIFEFLYEILPSLEEKVEIFLTNAVKSLVLPDRQAPVTEY